MKSKLALSILVGFGWFQGCSLLTPYMFNRQQRVSAFKIAIFLSALFAPNVF